MDEVVPTSALSPAQSPTQSPDEMQLAIGFAIREELARSGDLDGAVAKARDLVRDAEAKGISISEAAQQQRQRPPQPWLALADYNPNPYPNPRHNPSHNPSLAPAITLHVILFLTLEP